MKSFPRFRRDEGAPPWTLTFSDMVTLLLVFFVFLYSMSAIDVAKFKAFISSFQGVGVLDWGPAPVEESPPSTEAIPQVVISEQLMVSQANLTQAYQMVTSYLKEHGLEDEVGVRMEQRGIALEIKDRILFDSGKADLKPESKRVLDPLAGLFERLQNEILVEGHTDSRPINTVQFPTNWELSTARAARVVRYFVDTHRLDARKFAAVGYGEFRPVAPNDSWENMALNRRVVILINAVNPYEGEVSP